MGQGCGSVFISHPSKGTSMTKKQRAYLHIITLPFVISAAVEFLPAWVYWPVALLCGMALIGACAILNEKENT